MTTGPPAPSPRDRHAPPTRLRYGVLGFACALSMITYLDRACLGSAAKAFVHDLGLSGVGDLKWVFTAFTVAYALFEIPSGWLGDVFGPRKVLIRIVLWWSAFTALTGLVGMTVGGSVLGAFQLGSLVVTPLAVLIVVRFLFGMGEAGAYPNITRTLHNWFPLRQRGFAQGAVWMCGRLMGGLTPLVWTLLVGLVPWRATFWVFGAVGVVWCLLFAAWFRNRPEEKRGVNQAELELIRAGKVEANESQTAHAGVPWSRLLASPNLWTLCLMYACQSYGWVFYMTYLPSFLEDHYGVEATSTLGAIYKGGPLWMGALGCLAGGLATDWFVRRTGNRRLGRRLFGVLGHALTVLCFLVCPWMPTAFWFFVAVSLSGFFTDLTMGPAWAVCQDIGRRYAAIVAGAMNMMGAAGGAIANWATGLLLQRSLAAHAAGLGLGPEELSAAEKAAGELAGWLSREGAELMLETLERM
ncbi:MAG: MFS transporter, partial [Thermoguttaceae bacterium]|nr:MFS transporter [Thermoguttaceae bacterium]